MYVDRVTLKNLRGFPELEFDLSRGNATHAGWTVFTGNNGSGKSSLLKAIAVALTGRDTAVALQTDFHGWVRAHQPFALIELEIVRVKADDQLSETGRPPALLFPAAVRLDTSAGSTRISEQQPAKKTQKNYATPQRTIWGPEGRGWFSCGYGPYRRMFGASSEATRQMVAPTTERFVTMFQEAASLGEVDQWLRRLNHKKLEGDQSATTQLAVILEILRDELVPNSIEVDRVDSDGIWLRDSQGVELQWRDMSDGYRAALALLSDILRHFINAFGIDGLTERDDKDRLVIARSGVVLIDEIDAHLHPEWQQRIGFWLKSHFPKVQFIVTTHSPLICQAADENGLFVLPELGSNESPRALSKEEYLRIIASRPDTILLTDAFGLENTRSPEAVLKRAEFSRLSAKKNSGAPLSLTETEQMEQLKLFVEASEDA